MTSHKKNDHESASQLRFKALQRTIVLLLFLLVASTIWYLWSKNTLSLTGVLQLVDKHHVLAPVAFVVFYALALIFLLPTLPLNIGAGFVWGPWLGALYSVLGCTFGGCGAFLFARTTFGQPLARSFESRILKRLAQAVAENGWKVVAFTRVNPVMPTAVLNYLFGLTAIRLSTFCWATVVYSFPLSLLFSYLGHSTGSFLIENDLVYLLRIIGLALGLAVLVYAGGKFFPREMTKQGGHNRRPS